MTKARKMSAPPRRYVGPSAQLPGSVLEALVSKDQLPVALEHAWWHIIHTFAGAETPNRIDVCEKHVTSLAERIVEQMSDEACDEVFSADQLPDGYGLYLQGTPTEVARSIVRDLIIQQLAAMWDDKQQRYMWYQSGGWCISPTARSRYDKSVRRVIPNSRGRSDYPRSTGKNAMVPWPPRVIAREIRTAGMMS